jgi:uncharacterized protein YbjT (DUF2867 family)
MDPSRTTLLAGATGLVGRELLTGLLADSAVGAVHTLGRRVLRLSHPKLTQHIVDFKALPALPRVDEVYLALGTTIKAAGSQEAFRAVDYDANLAVAMGALAAGAGASDWSAQWGRTRAHRSSTAASRASWRTRSRNLDSKQS